MYCIALEANQKRINGKIRYFMPGETHEFEECPANFAPIDEPPTVEEGEVDYATMGEVWLRQYDGDPTKLALFIMDTYKDAKLPPNATWNELVDILQVQKETNVLMIDNTGKRENRLTAIEQTTDTITVTIDDGKPEPAAKTPTPTADEVKKAELVEKKAAKVKKETADPTKSEALSQQVEAELDDLFKDN